MCLPYEDADPSSSHRYLWPPLRRLVAERTWAGRRAFDLGCGSGATSGLLADLGFDVVGVDLSESGVAQARARYSQARFDIGDAYDDLAARYGQFDLVVSLEVVEHCARPRDFARTFLSLIAPGGVGVLSTPYHGYLKNLALAATGRLDRHFTALWDGGHVKFFSIRTLRTLFAECGAPRIEISRVGRIAPLAKSMIALVERPAAGA